MRGGSKRILLRLASFHRLPSCLLTILLIKTSGILSAISFRYRNDRESLSEKQVHTRPVIHCALVKPRVGHVGAVAVFVAPVTGPCETAASGIGTGRRIPTFPKTPVYTRRLRRSHS